MKKDEILVRAIYAATLAAEEHRNKVSRLREPGDNYSVLTPKIKPLPGFPSGLP